MQFILGSSSPRRKELLESIGIIPDLIIGPDIDESNLKDELPTACAKRLAKNKAVKIKNDYPDSLILTADSIAFCGRRIIDKTDNVEVARDYLKLLSQELYKYKISSFRYDKRGVAESLGDTKFANEIKFQDYVKDAIEIIAPPKSMVAITIIIGKIFGRMWLNMIRILPKPIFEFVV